MYVVSTFVGLIELFAVLLRGGLQIHVMAIDPNRHLVDRQVPNSFTVADLSIEVVPIAEVLSLGTNSLDAFVRRFDGQFQDIIYRGVGWSSELFSGSGYRGFPTAVVTSPYLRVYGIGYRNLTEQLPGLFG